MLIFQHDWERDEKRETLTLLQESAYTFLGSLVMRTGRQLSKAFMGKRQGTVNKLKNWLSIQNCSALTVILKMLCSRILLTCL